MNAVKQQPSHHLARAASVGLSIILCGIDPTPAAADITKLVINNVTPPAFGGTDFGTVGQYEKLDGVAFGEVDPKGEMWWPLTSDPPYVVKVGGRFVHVDRWLRPLMLERLDAVGLSTDASGELLLNPGPCPPPRAGAHFVRWRAPHQNHGSKAPMTDYWIEDLGYSVENFTDSGNLLEALASLHDLDAARAAYQACRVKCRGNRIRT